MLLPAAAPEADHVLEVQDCEGETECGLELVLPLRNHAGWSRYDHQLDVPPQQQLANNKPRSDRLAQAEIAGNQQADRGRRRALRRGSR